MNGAEKAQHRLLRGHRSRQRALVGSLGLNNESVYQDADNVESVPIISGAEKDIKIAEAARAAGAQAVPHVVEHEGVISVSDPNEIPPPGSEVFHG